MEEVLALSGMKSIAKAAGCSRKTLYEWIERKGFPAFKIDDVWKATPSDIKAWLQAQKAKFQGTK
ncbi:MAG TPA: helix-turn-helix domain-containing protein [Candidatus Sulfotelmatobacter sp.]|nr:helix-turn-helix domain-containing protein [Candidatus Sulfotelmatobacter sp.]